MANARTVALIVSALVLLPAGARGQAPPGPKDRPAQLEGIDLVDHSGDSVPLDVMLVDETGKPVRLGDFLGHGRPVVVQLLYFDCPMLCSLVLNGFVDAAKELDWSPGKDYDVLAVSFDPRDKPEVAAKKKANYAAALGKGEAGWHFLTGSENQVRTLADALGFGYKWVPEQKQFAHAAGLFVLTPEGKISRTLYGIQFPSKELKLSLVEAGEGKLGSPLDKLILFCFHYDPETHKYAMVATNVMKLGGLVTMVLLGGFVVVLWSRDRRRHHAGHAV